MEAEAYNPEPDLTSGAPGAHIWGWMTPRELYWLHAAALHMRNVAEVGCLHGRSTFALCAGCPGNVWAVDPWETQAGYDSFLANCGHFENLMPLRGYSPGMAVAVPDVDLVFIDGDHNTVSVMDDLAAWTPKARELICGHDYGHAEYPGVTAVVDDVFGDRVRVVPQTGIWYVEIP